MRICVYGVGAIGGSIAVRLIHSGAKEVSVIARGSALAAITECGLTLKDGVDDITVRPAIATDNPDDLAPQDLIIVALKAPSIPAIAKPLGKLLRGGGTAVFMINGVPWWWNHGRPGQGGALPLLDPEGALWREVGPERALGAVLYASHKVVEPGITQYNGGNRWIFGEPDGSISSRLATLTALFRGAALNAESAPDIRREIWRKLLGNATINPLCALTRLTLDELATESGLIEFGAGVIGELLTIGAAVGCDLRDETDIDAVKMPPSRVKGARPSMLQDIEHGQVTEVEAIIGQAYEFGKQLGIETPSLSTLLFMMRGLDRAVARNRLVR